jgi:transposase InsO family protein
MLQYFWPGPSKTGRQVPQVPAAASEIAQATTDVEGRVEATEEAAAALDGRGAQGCVTKATAAGKEEGTSPPYGVPANPLAPPGEPAEFSDSPPNVQEEVEDAQEASAASAIAPSECATATDLLAAVAAGPRLTGGLGCPRPPSGLRRGRRLVKPAAKAEALNGEQRLLLLDTWLRSGLPAGDFAALVGISKHSLYAWKKKFQQQGPAGLMEQPRGGPRGSRLPDLTKRTILLLKASNPSWGCQRISDMLVRGPALPASPSAVARVLHEAGYEMEEVTTRPHPDHVRFFERAQPNQLWQTDLFTFVLKRQNRRVYLVAFMDDHSRFIVGYGLHASQSSALVLEVLRAALTSYGTPEEILTDNGSQYVTWRGKSAFSKELDKRGIKQVVAKPRRPQTLGKIERFWGTLWRECIESAVFIDLGDAQRRIGLFMDHYNFQRPHRGADGLAPADRFFGAASEVKKTLQARVAANALELARNGLPKQPFYLTGQVGGQPFSVHAEGERVILTGAGGARQEVDLVPPAEKTQADAELPEPVCPAGVVTGLVDEGLQEPPAPGESPWDEGLERLRKSLPGAAGGDA